MKFKQVFLYFSLFIFSFSFLSAQQHADHLLPLKSNPALVSYVKNAKKSHAFVWRLISDSIVLNLPFLDDFSHGGPYPNDSLWMDNAAYINNTYPTCPPTLGVATLDGVDNQGQPYNRSCPSGASYPADSLTSRPINLTQYGYKDADSIWFSFYWQAGGISTPYTPPLTADTLLLQFRTSKTPWTTVWYQLGYTPVFPDTGFHLVMIPMLDTIHTILWNDTNDNIPGGKFNPYDPDFQFRFKNYACTSANADQWNIDEVYLDRFRSYNDSVNGPHALNDISFVYEAPSLLTNYEYMPWEQFTQADLKDTMYIPMRSNYNSPLPLSDTTFNNTGSVGAHGGDANIDPFNTSGYATNYFQTHLPVKSIFLYTPLTGPDTVTQTTILRNANDFIPWNDTLRFKQTFSDYYAYDDGTAEASYFINGTTPLALSEEFTLNNADTLRGLELYFNYMFVDPANYNMVLAVWNNDGPGGSPMTVLFQDDTVATPRVSDTLNGFTYYPYHTATPLVIGAGQTIYVGWIQTNGDSLNIGFDLNTNSSNKICYYENTNTAYWYTGWSPCDYAGSIMMRPVFGHNRFHSPTLNAPDVKTPLAETLNIYPNPANNMVTISPTMPPNTTLKIYTADGRECVSNANFYGNSINTSALANGFYIVEIIPQGEQTSYNKLLIQR